MHFLISAGASGGHIYPAIVLIEKILKMDNSAKIAFVGTRKGPEYEEIKKLKIDYWPIESYYFDSKNIFQSFKMINSFIKNYFILKKKMKKFKPDVVIGFGGHVTIPVIYTANKLKIKTFIHEQNKILGRANRFLSKYVDAIFVSYQNTEKIKPGVKVIYTGNPVSENAINIKEYDKKQFGLVDNKKLVLIMMGSQGAALINQYLEANLNSFKTDDYQILYVTGKRNYQKKYKGIFKENIVVVPYIDSLVKIMKKADLIVSRAGATTIAEIIALRKPAILIPSPYVPDNHQYYNACDLFQKKAAVLLKDKELKKLKKLIESLIKNDVKLNTLANNLEEFVVDNSATLIYNNSRHIGSK